MQDAGWVVGKENKFIVISEGEAMLSLKALSEGSMLILPGQRSHMAP